MRWHHTGMVSDLPNLSSVARIERSEIREEKSCISFHCMQAPSVLLLLLPVLPKSVV